MAPALPVFAGQARSYRSLLNLQESERSPQNRSSSIAGKVSSRT
ncbi:hypothetical protein J2W83_004078 [Pseudomonas hunanensis]|uniref:Uncharacterized protein n=1 Tax=Pseudomonas hunanensis TaxID=1247546 RepID=A0ACC6K7Q4_9PSED|nr:hypothetical protein [Pseudomonas hunanensis]